MGIARKLVRSQVILSAALDRMLPKELTVDGYTHFTESFAPRYLRPGMKVYDIGAGKRPHIDPETKRRLGLQVVGLDIDQGELDRAPAGAYDEVVCADITQYRGKGDADLVICQALLEHVRDVEKAFETIASILKPGGEAVIFVPSRNAVFARLNLLMPHELKRQVMFTVFPHTKQAQGFPSYYDRCTPADFRALAVKYGLTVEEAEVYFASFYFSFFFPLYAAWRAWTMAFRAVAGDQAAESFAMALRKLGRPV